SIPAYPAMWCPRLPSRKHGSAAATDTRRRTSRRGLEGLGPTPGGRSDHALRGWRTSGEGGCRTGAAALPCPPVLPVICRSLQERRLAAALSAPRESRASERAAWTRDGAQEAVGVAEAAGAAESAEPVPQAA